MKPPTYLHLLVVEENNHKRLIYLKNKLYSLGRDLHNSIVISDGHVSRFHATIIKEYDCHEQIFVYKIIDGTLTGKSSHNGLYINGGKFSEKYLEYGDLIRFSNQATAHYYIINRDSNLRDIFNSTDTKINTVDNLIKQDFNKATLTSDEEFLEKINGDQASYLYKLASFSELSPYPIIEINLQGKITYYNQAASLIFKDLPEKQLNHPILADILPTTDKEHGSLLVREISIKEQTFAQYIHYLPQLKLIRNYIFDLTERKIIEQELQNSEAKYKAVVKQINEGIFLVDANSKQIIETNEAASQLLGYSPQELTTFKVDDFLVNKHQEFSQYLRNVLNNNNYNITKELEYKHKQGHVIDVEISATVINYAQRQIICFVFRNITKRKHLEDKLKYTAYHDNLTGLYNRSFFNEYFKKALINAKRQNHLIAIMFIDLDHFKEINDNYGHKFGDELLQQFAQRLQTCLRSQDITARWGGDEFTILLPNIHTEKEVIKIAERIINSLKNPFQIGANPISLRSSIGISIYPDHAQDPETLLIKADLALYCTKEKGRNNYLLYHTDINN